MSRIVSFDVCVVGAGPAGSTCAEFLGKAGLRVALFDASFPREKPCGGGVSLDAIKEFRLPRSVADRIPEKLLLESPRFEPVEIESAPLGFLVMREKFDSFLLERAKKNCVFFPERVLDVSRADGGWTVYSEKRKASCSILVGADGVNSLVRNAVAKPIPAKLLGECVGYHFPMPPSQVNEFFGKRIEIYFNPAAGASGYAWIFPKKSCVTVGLGLRLGEKNAKNSLDSFVAGHPAAKRLASCPPSKARFHSHLIPFVNKASFFDLPASGKDWALVGDAAGHVNPLTGEGIVFAMLGGKLAAQSIAEGDLHSFEHAWRHRFGSFLYWGARFHDAFYDWRFLNSAIGLARKSAFMKRFLKEIVIGATPYDELFAEAALLAPKVLLDQFS